MDLELTDQQVKKIAGSGTKMLLYTDLYKYNSLEKVFGSCKKLILLYIHDKNGNSISGHWCCLINHPNRVEFFDSYSLLPDQLLYKYKTKAERMKTNQLHNYLTTLLYSYTKKPIEYNEYKYQKVNDNINTCGRWTGLRLRYSTMPLEKFQKIMNTFKKAGYNMDELVTELTNNYLR